MNATFLYCRKTPLPRVILSLTVLVALASSAFAIDRDTYLRNTAGLDAEIVARWTTALNDVSGETISRDDVFKALPSIEILFANGKFLSGVSQQFLTRMKSVKSRRDEWKKALEATVGAAVRPANVVLFLIQKEALFPNQALDLRKDAEYLAALKTLSANAVAEVCKGGKFEENTSALWALIEEKSLTATAPGPASASGGTLESNFSDYSKYLVIVEGNAGSGSGFIVKLKGNALVATNAHVLSGNDTVQLSLLNSTKIPRGTIGFARDYDLAVITQTALPDGLEVLQGVDNEARMGDAVVVLGNSQGSKVVTEIRGKIVGMGPDLVEVDARFIPGNSGSPIIHLKSGKVIGIATYVEAKRRDWTSKDSNLPEVRRFGYRLDTVAKWEFPKWEAFQQEAKTVAKVTQNTENLVNMLVDMFADGRVNPLAHNASDNRLRSYTTDLAQALTKSNVAPATLQEAKTRFFRGLIHEATSDVNGMRMEGFTGYHGKMLKEQMELRQVIKKEFERLSSIQTAAGKINLP